MSYGIVQIKCEVYWIPVLLGNYAGTFVTLEPIRLLGFAKFFKSFKFSSFFSAFSCYYFPFSIFSNFLWKIISYFCKPLPESITRSKVQIGR